MFQTKAFAVPHTTRLMRIMKKERRRPNLRRDLVALLQQLIRQLRSKIVLSCAPPLLTTKPVTLSYEASVA
uniref:Uncharacterized protein n=1 Tax=Pristionchus pacificus TaxID=54126 RepID=A0A2A6CEG9_PRIPA|eukprot:PDM76506.1 hypothetical protein PRIPAC_42872 [Pristionchus pacificus]